MSEYIIITTDISFEKEVIQSNLPVLVDFWAPWCNPCKMFSPIFKEVAASDYYLGKVKFVQHDTAAHPEKPQQFNVQSIPTLLLFDKGQLKARNIGSVNKSKLMAFIDDNL